MKLYSWYLLLITVANLITRKWSIWVIKLGNWELRRLSITGYVIRTSLILRTYGGGKSSDERRPIGICKDDKLWGLTWQDTFETQYQSQYCLSSAQDPYIRRRCGKDGVWEPLETETTCLTTDNVGGEEYVDAIYLQLQVWNIKLLPWIYRDMSFTIDNLVGCYN